MRTSFASRQELLQHISRTRERYALTSDTLGKALAALRVQQELVDTCERAVHEVGRAVAAMENEKSQCDASLQQLREVIATFPTQIEAPTDEELNLLEAELRSTDEELATLKNNIDDRTARFGAAQNEV